MLKLREWLRSVDWTPILASALVLVLALWRLSDYENNESNPNSNQYGLYQAINSITADEVIAAFTVILAAVGFFTYFTFRRQAEVMSNTLDQMTIDAQLARDEFRAAYPPELVVRDVLLTSVDRDKEAVTAITFTITNKGRHECKIVGSAFLRSNEREPIPNPDGRSDLIEQVSIAPGHTVHVQQPLLGDGGAVLAFATLNGMFEDQFFAGSVIYEDADGFRRTTAFRRVCKRDSGNNFVLTGDPADEYTD